MNVKRSLVLAVAATVALSGCTSAADDGRPRVLASIYPLQFLVQEIAGDRVDVGSVTPAGAEPHDLELAPAQVRELRDADALVYVSGFQPAVDDAVRSSGGGARLVDAAVLLGLEEEDGAAHDDEEAHVDEEAHDDEEAHVDEEADAEASGPDSHAGHDHAGDPHFWLDPTMLAALADPVAETLTAIDPAGAETFAANAARIAGELSEIDEEFSTGLASCQRDVVVVAHEAYGYLAERYGLTQVGLSGLDPEGEPSPARLREIRDTIAEHDVTTIFTESLVNPKAAEVLASDLGLSTALLDPVEAQNDPAADYRDVMRNNLAALTEALGCE